MRLTLETSSRALTAALVACLGPIAAPDAGAQSEADIQRAQNLLLELGYELGEADGLYGPQTRRAVRAFQSDWDLDVDGEIGPDLFQKLGSAAPTVIPVENIGGCAISVIDPRPQETVAWSGVCVEGRPEGEGVLVRRFQLAGAWAEWWYEGGLVAGEPSGRGVRITPRGDRYEGEWLGGERHGVGEETFADGTRYVGDWRYGLYDGVGRLETTDGLVYQGDWEGGLRDGRGAETYPNGDRYEGQYVFDSRKGLGVYALAEGGFYDGAWSNGLPEGEGVYRSVDGRVASGVWSAGCLRLTDVVVAFLVPPESCDDG